MNYLPACNAPIAISCEHHRVRAASPTGNRRQNLAAKPIACPSDLNRLSELLVRDLPSYANRKLQQNRKRTDPFYSSMINAGALEFQPLENLSREYPPRFPQERANQIFITTLERQYTGIRSAQLQQFHWLFLAKTSLGWRLANMYTRTGGSPQSGTPVSPPIESSNTIVGTAIRTWLNDCYLGKLRGS